jgi:O-antigen ligase
MLTHDHQNRSLLAIAIPIVGVLIGIFAGLLAGTKALYLGLILGALSVAICVFVSFEYTVLGLLILRSALDPFSAQQIPALFAVGLDALTLVYATVLLLSGRAVQVDRFWWFLAGWVALQGLWVVLLPLGGLGLDAEFISVSIREWVRLFSWLMVYLLVMQLKDRLPPQKVISLLLLALVIPLGVALLQLVVPSLLPDVLSAGGGDVGSLSGAGRIKGTLGLSNTFATLLLLFIGLTWWKLGQAERPLRWMVLLGTLAFFFVSTKALFSLIMLSVFILVLVAPRLNPLNFLGGVLLLALVIGLFASTDFGQQRLASIADTPLLNPDIDISRAILLSQSDHNSFNWRLSQWNLLLNAWRHYPVLGYGLGLSIQTSGNGLLPHNDYIRALIEGGIVGLFTFLAFLVAQAVRLLQLIRWSPPGGAQQRLCLVLLAIFLSVPVGMLTENIWSHTTFFFYWWTLLAVAGWDWSVSETASSTAMPAPLPALACSFHPDTPSGRLE